MFFIKGLTMPRAIQYWIPVFLLLTAFLRTQSAFAGAKDKIDSLKKVLVTQKDTARMSTLLLLSKAWLKTNKDSALHYALLLKIEAIAQNELQRICDAYVVVGTCYHHLHEDDSAIHYKRMAIPAARIAGYPKGEANASSDLGLYLDERGEIDSALFYTLRGATLREDINDERALITSYNNLAMIYYHKGDSNSSIVYYRRAAYLCSRHSRPDARTAVLNNLAVLYDEMKQYDSALFYYNIVKRECDSLEDEDGYARALINIGYTYTQLGRYEEAIKLFEEAAEIKARIDEPDGEARANLNLARTYCLMKQFDLCEKYLVRADTIAQHIEQKEVLRDVYQVYVDLYNQTNRGALAVEYFKKYRELNQQLLTDEQLRLTEEMQERFETQKKEKENLLLKEQQRLSEEAAAESKRRMKLLIYSVIVLVVVLGLSVYAYRTKIKAAQELQEKNEQISRQNSTLKELNKKLIDSEEELTQLNSTKDELFSIISHDLGNPVNAIVNYNTVLRNQKETMTKEEMAQSLDKVNITLQPLQGFLDNLLQWSIQQRNGIAIRNETVNVSEVLKEITALYNASLLSKRVTVQQEVPEALTITTDKNALRLILRNILGNAIKYSPENGVVHVSCRVVDAKPVIEVRNAGQSIDKEKIKQILAGQRVTSQRGSIDEQGTGLGLSLVKQYLDAMQGQMEIESGNDETLVRIYLNRQ